MNPQLFIDVIERAVGPVRASHVRRDRMREELAAHLAASWEEERRRDGDGPAAALRAIQRLGNAGELSRGLQDSVPRLERWLCTPLPLLKWLDDLDRALRRSDRETPFGHAARVTAQLTAAIAAVEILVVPVSAAIQNRPPSDWPTVALWAVASLLTFAAGAFVFPLICEAVVHALQGAHKSWTRVSLYLALSSLAVVGLGLGFVLIVSLGGHREVLFAWSDWLRLLAASLFAPPLLAFAAHDEHARRRGRGGWGIAETSA